MKRVFLILFLTTAVIFSACGGGGEDIPEGNASPVVPQIQTAPPVTPPPVVSPSDEPVVFPVEPVLPTEPAHLTVEDIPQGDEPAEFLRELGYESFATHEFLGWGEDWIALRTNTAIRDFRIIELIPRYEASFTGEWQFERHYMYTWTRLSVDLMPDEPLVMSWQADEWDISGRGLDGIAFLDADGRERFFVFRQNDGATYLKEFEDSPPGPDTPRITITHPSPQIELVTALIAGRRGDGDEAETSDFLRQFEAYTEFDNPYVDDAPWLVFGANTDLRDFQFFLVGQVCDPWIGDEWHPFFIATVPGSQEVLPFGEPVIVPWISFGTMPAFGIGFLDETGSRRNFTINLNTGSGYPFMFLLEFTDRGHCPDCAENLP